MLEARDYKYWQYRWIDEFDIHTMKDFSKVVKKRRNIDRFAELSVEQAAFPLHERPTLPNSVVAGRRIDLSGGLGCVHFDCITPQIDALFGRIWHYFDSVTIDGHYPIPDLDSESARDAEMFYWGLEQRIKLLLHLRKIGAEPYLDFAPKPHSFCSEHYRKCAERFGISIMSDEDVLNKVTNRLLRESRISIKRYPDSWHYTLSHPRMDSVYGEFSHSEEITERPSAEKVVAEVLGRHCNSVVMDLYTATTLKRPLIQTPDAFWISVPSNDADKVYSEKSVALEIRLPVLRGVPARELIRMRQDEWSHFERFRDALRRAVNDQITQSGDKHPQEIARSVVEDYVNPELARIESRLQAARKTLARKLGANVSLGGVATTIGALSAAPLIATTGIATTGIGTIVASLTQIHKYFDEKSEIELSDLYFLWKVKSSHRRG